MMNESWNHFDSDEDKSFNQCSWYVYAWLNLVMSWYVSLENR